MTRKELDTVMEGVSDMLNSTATKMSEAVVVALDKSETALLAKITALENRLKVAENRLNQEEPPTALPINPVPAGTPSEANTYEY